MTHPDTRTIEQYAAAQIVIVAMHEPPEIADPLFALAARLLAPIELEARDA